MTQHLLATVDASGWETLLRQCLDGLSFGALIALIALGYTMVYGIIGLINFAHGDLFMLGGFATWTLIRWLGLEDASNGRVIGGIALMLVLVPIFCAALNWSIDRLIYRPLRDAPKLAPLVSAIGVSFVFMNIAQFWGGTTDINIPPLVSAPSILLIAVVVPMMIGLTVLVKWTQIGRAMRATAQNPVAARLMGINVDRVIGATFLTGGALGGVASVIYSLKIHTIDYQMGYQNGLYAFTAAVLGGIGNIPGAVLGGLVIGLVRYLGSQWVGDRWVNALIFGVLILILIFRPTGLMGERAKEKV